MSFPGRTGRLLDPSELSDELREKLYLPPKGCLDIRDEETCGTNLSHVRNGQKRPGVLFALFTDR